MDPKQVPIYSARDDDPDLQEELSEFVIGLAEEIDQLQDTEADGDLERLDELSHHLGQRARRYGYEILAEVAFALCQACREHKPDSAQQGLVELTGVAQRIRRGHRGSA
jgi:hypothetical protein